MALPLESVQVENNSLLHTAGSEEHGDTMMIVLYAADAKN